MCPKNLKNFKIKKILIIGTESLGDNLLLTPAVKKIRDTFKDAEIDIVTGQGAVEFAADNPWFSGYIVYKQGGKLSRIVNLAKLLNKLNKKRYDLIVDFRNSLLPFFVRGRYRLTFFLKELFSEKIFTHESERILNFLTPYFGKSEEPSLHFSLSKKDRDDANLSLRNAGIKPSDRIVILNPGGMETERRWPWEKFAAAGSELLKNYDSLKIVITGFRDEESVASKIKERINSKDVHVFAGKTSLKQLAALIEKAVLIITNDTGTLHLASAVHCPTVAVFGPTNPYRYGPLGTKNIVVHSDIPCFPCNKKRCWKDYMCIKEISPSEVTKAAMLFLDEKEQPLLFDL